MHTHVLEETVSLPSDTSAEVNAFTDTPTGTGTGTDTDTDTQHTLSFSLSLTFRHERRGECIDRSGRKLATWTQLLRQYLYFCTSFCVSICTFGPASASVFVLLY